MGMGLTVFLWLIGLFALFIVIRAAINGSDMANDISAIRELLEKKFSSDVVESDETALGNENAEQAAQDANASVYTECPACGTKLSGTEKECPECGLVIR